MMKRLVFLLFAGLVAVAPCSSFADDMDFDEFAIVDQDDTGIDTEDVSLNADASSVDVKHFDIAGAMLGMSYDEIKNLFFDGGGLYAPRKKNSVIYTINKEWKYNLDYECRQSNIFIPEKLEKCIYSLAQNRGLLYIAEMHLERAFTGETLDIYFTSNATDNLVWKIVYTNDANTLEGIDGNDNKFNNQREKKLLAFWQGVLDKYGTPNSDEDKWISSENAYDPMMQAFYGQLVLTDKGLEASDAAENVQKARQNFQAKPYAF